VGHPLNFIVSLAIVQLPLVTLGARPETLFLFNALMGLQGLVSHFNVDIKAGPLNYLLVGAELHRFHHSANLNEAQNFGVLTPFWIWCSAPSATTRSACRTRLESLTQLNTRPARRSARCFCCP